MNFNATQQQLLTYCKENKIWRNFLPIAELLIIVTGLLQIVGNFVSLGIFATFIAILAYIAIIMTLAKGNYKVLALGLSLRTIDYILAFIIPIISTHPRFSWSSLIWGAVWALFTLSAFKKSGMSVNDVKANMNVNSFKNAMNLDEAKQFNFDNVRKDATDAYKNTASSINDIKSQMSHKQQ